MSKPPRLFTQEEVDSIVKERLSHHKRRHARELAEMRARAERAENELRLLRGARENRPNAN